MRDLIPGFVASSLLSACLPNEANGEPRPGAIVKMVEIGCQEANPVLPSARIDVGCSVGRGSFALAAARALMENTDLPARKIAEEAMKIAGKICIFTNENFVVEELAASPEKAGAPAPAH